MKPKLYVNIAISSGGTCNLRCPSCPVSERQFPVQHMAPELFERIADKLARETKPIIVYLFGHSEPLLNPHLEAYAAECAKRGLRFGLSSNFSLTQASISRLFAIAPDSVRVSVCGFSQSVYEIGHAGGNISRVLSNLCYYSHSRPSAKLCVLWHRYPHNEHERLLMRSWCEERGIAWQECEAVLLPWESVMESFIQGTKRETPHFYTPLSIARAKCELVKHRNCYLQTRSIAINVHGNVAPCCSIYDSEAYRLGSFLDYPIEKLMQLKLKNTVCRKCKAIGAHIYTVNEWKWANRLRAVLGRMRDLAL